MNNIDVNICCACQTRKPEQETTAEEEKQQQQQLQQKLLMRKKAKKQGRKSFVVRQMDLSPEPQQPKPRSKLPLKMVESLEIQRPQESSTPSRKATRALASLQDTSSDSEEEEERPSVSELRVSLEDDDGNSILDLSPRDRWLSKDMKDEPRPRERKRRGQTKATAGQKNDDEVGCRCFFFRFIC